MFELWYAYITPTNDDKADLYYRDTETFTINAKLKMFIKTLQMMLKKDLEHQITK